MESYSRQKKVRLESWSISRKGKQKAYSTSHPHDSFFVADSQGTPLRFGAKRIPQTSPLTKVSGSFANVFERRGSVSKDEGRIGYTGTKSRGNWSYHSQVLVNNIHGLEKIAPHTVTYDLPQRAHGIDASACPIETLSEFPPIDDF
jgi:hypothetical protein